MQTQVFVSNRIGGFPKMTILNINWTKGDTNYFCVTMVNTRLTLNPNPTAEEDRGHRSRTEDAVRLKFAHCKIDENKSVCREVIVSRDGSSEIYSLFVPPPHPALPAGKQVQRVLFVGGGSDVLGAFQRDRFSRARRIPGETQKSTKKMTIRKQQLTAVRCQVCPITWNKRNGRR